MIVSKAHSIVTFSYRSQAPNMAGNCTLFVDHQNYCVVLSAVKQTMASLQLLGSLFIIFIIWLFRTYKYFHQRLILALSSAAFMGSISFMLTDIPPLEGTLCSLQAWMITYFVLTILSWVCCITFNIWRAMNGDRAKRFEKFYHMISWGVPLVVATIPLTINLYGPAGPWCWIADDRENNAAWRFGIYYIPLFVCIIGLFIAYTYIFVTHRRQAKQWAGIHARNNSAEYEQRKLRMSYINALMAYPCIYLIMSLAPFIHRVHNAISNERSFVLILLHVICIPLTGLINAIAFGFNKETLNRLNWRQIKAAFKQHFPFGKAQMDSSVGEHRLGEPTRADTILDEHPYAGRQNRGEHPSPTQYTNDVSTN